MYQTIHPYPSGNDAIIDEWTFGEYQDKGVARAKLEQHWNTWITERDFADIAAAGFVSESLPMPTTLMHVYTV